MGDSANVSTEPHQPLLPQLRQQALNGVSVVLLHALARGQAFPLLLAAGPCLLLTQGRGRARLLLHTWIVLRHLALCCLNALVYLQIPLAVGQGTSNTVQRWI